MTREQAREAAAIMLAWADGKTIQCRRRSRGEWCGIEPGCKATILSWDWDEFEYRVKPEPKLRPWTADEVPLGAWMRWKVGSEYRLLISCTEDDGTLCDWLAHNEHSLDGGKTWLPCGVEEAKP